MGRVWEKRAFYGNGAGNGLSQLCGLCSQPLWDYMDLPTIHHSLPTPKHKQAWKHVQITRFGSICCLEYSSGIQTI